MIDKRADVPARHFMHKTRFASSKKAHQEVDIACGLRDGVVLALECKVTNDDTNSVKRINDVMKKATAWKDRFGVFVRPAALLQGVMKFSDVEQLLDANIAVFWTHRLDLFSAWLSEQERHMTSTGHDTLGTRSTFDVGGRSYTYYSLAKAAAKLGNVDKLPSR